jgi:hypothetical protein
MEIANLIDSYFIIAVRSEHDTIVTITIVITFALDYIGKHCYFIEKDFGILNSLGSYLCWCFHY